MKIRNPNIIKWIGFVGSVIICLWVRTLSLRLRSVAQDVVGFDIGPSERAIFVFWHENILVPCYHYAGQKIYVLISQHADGEMIARVCQHLGYGTIRGSKTHGGMKALRELIRVGETHDLAVMPDGPRGPRRHVELGLIYLAAKTGLPIFLMGVGYDRPWRLNTWDRFVIPRPWSRVVLLTQTIPIPHAASKAQLEEYRERIENILNEMNDQAERLASRCR